MVSNCCKDQLIVENGDEGTNYYCCRACGNPCSPFDDRDWKIKFKDRVFIYNTNMKRDGLDFIDDRFMNDLEKFIQSTIEDEVKKERERIKAIEVRVMQDDPDSIMPCRTTRTIGSLYGKKIDLLEE